MSSPLFIEHHYLFRLSNTVYRSLTRLRTPQRHVLGSSPSKVQRRKRVLAEPAPLENFSAQRATWLFLRQPGELDETQQAELALIRQASPSAETAYGLAQAFMHMIREHTGHQLDVWRSSVEASHLPEVKSIARGIQQDKAAVFAGLTRPWSNGPLEGHVNRLKLMKRSMYGRAKLPLLRQRVLHHPKNTQAGKVERSPIQRHVKQSSDLAPTSSSKPLTVSLSEVA